MIEIDGLIFITNKILIIFAHSNNENKGPLKENKIF